MSECFWAFRTFSVCRWNECKISVGGRELHDWQRSKLRLQPESHTPPPIGHLHTIATFNDSYRSVFGQDCWLKTVMEGEAGSAEKNRRHVKSWSGEKGEARAPPSAWNWNRQHGMRVFSRIIPVHCFIFLILYTKYNCHHAYWIINIIVYYSGQTYRTRQSCRVIV